MRLITTETHKEALQIFWEILRFILEVASIEVDHSLGIFWKLSVIIDISENQALVEPLNKLIEKEFSHVNSDVLPLQRGFLNVAANFNVVVCWHSVVNDQQPHSHIFDWVEPLCAWVSSGELADEIVKQLHAVPNRLR